MPPAFRLVDERTAFDGQVFRVAVARFEATDGSTFERDIVRHPGAVGVVPVDDEGRVHLVRQYRAALDADLLEIPAGVRDVGGEDLERTAARELAEEVGLRAARFELLTAYAVACGMSDERFWCYLATGLAPCAHDRQGPEEQAMRVEVVPLADAVAMVATGEIADAKTIIGLLLAARRV